jgi:hypothetical protein
MSELSREQLLMAMICGKGPVYLRGVDLSLLDLSNAGWLMEADLRQANITHSNLSKANLRDSNLETANLQASNMIGTNLDKANLKKANLNVANLKTANLRNANLREASLIGCNLVRANLEGANLENADLEGATLEGANLRKATLNFANLRMANLQGANLEGASFVGTILDQDRSAEMLPVPVHGFAGVLSCIQLTDLIQLVCLSRSDVLIRVESTQGRGHIHVRSGRVYHAQRGTLRGEAAFFEMLRWDNGRFEAAPLPEEDMVSIDKPLEHLLIESMRQRDERVAGFRKERWPALLQELKDHLPITAYPSVELIDMIGKKGKEIDPYQEIRITDVFDSGDAIGILCSIIADEEVFIAPLRTIKVSGDHPLSDRLDDYQTDHQAKELMDEVHAV